jgi:hypothetical protein
MTRPEDLAAVAELLGVPVERVEQLVRDSLLVVPAMEAAGMTTEEALDLAAIRAEVARATTTPARRDRQPYAATRVEDGPAALQLEILSNPMVSSPEALDQAHAAFRARGAERTHDEAARIIGAELLMQRHGVPRTPATSAPPRRGYNKAERRRRMTVSPLSPSIWWMRDGSHPDDVLHWVRTASNSTHPVERAIIDCFRREMRLPAGQIEWEHLSPIFAEVALCFVLWFSSYKPKRDAYCGVVDGKPRGALARLSAHRESGRPIGPRAITRHLQSLGEMLGGQRVEGGGGMVGGILEFNQPSPEAALGHELPRSTAWYEDGTMEVQAFNLYRFVDESRLPKILPKILERSHARLSIEGGDPRSVYFDTPVIANLATSRDGGVQKESRAGPGRGSGAPRGALGSTPASESS